MPDETNIRKSYSRHLLSLCELNKIPKSPFLLKASYCEFYRKIISHSFLFDQTQNKRVVSTISDFPGCLSLRKKTKIQIYWGGRAAVNGPFDIIRKSKCWGKIIKFFDKRSKTSQNSSLELHQVKTGGQLLVQKW